MTVKIAAFINLMSFLTDLVAPPEGTSWGFGDHNTRVEGNVVFRCIVMVTWAILDRCPNIKNLFF